MQWARLARQMIYDPEHLAIVDATTPASWASPGRAFNLDDTEKNSDNMSARWGLEKRNDDRKYSVVNERDIQEEIASAANDGRAPSTLSPLTQSYVFRVILRAWKLRGILALLKKANAEEMWGRKLPTPTISAKFGTLLPSRAESAQAKITAVLQSVEAYKAYVRILVPALAAWFADHPNKEIQQAFAKWRAYMEMSDFKKE